MDIKNKKNSDIPVDAGLSLLGKKTEKGILSITGPKIILTNNEIKDIMNVIKPLENRVLLLKGATRNITCKEGWFLNFLRPLLTASSPLIKSILTLFTKRFLIPLGLSAGTSSVDPAIQIKSHGSGITALLISNKEMEDIMKIVKSFDESRSIAK